MYQTTLTDQRLPLNSELRQQERNMESYIAATQSSMNEVTAMRDPGVATSSAPDEVRCRDVEENDSRDKIQHVS